MPTIDDALIKISECSRGRSVSVYLARHDAAPAEPMGLSSRKLLNSADISTDRFLPPERQRRETKPLSPNVVKTSLDGLTRSACRGSRTRRYRRPASYLGVQS
jgi:hypothetical protein